MVNTTFVQEAAVKAKKSGRMLCEEPIQIFWHSRPQRHTTQRPEHNLQDPRLAAQGVEQGRVPPQVPGPPLQSDVFLKTGVKRQREIEGGGGTEEVGERVMVTSGGSQGKKSIWERLGERVDDTRTTKASFFL